MSGSSQLRSLFEIENARNMSKVELVSTFIPTLNFRRLCSPKNHIIIGARGSGKTALAKMLSHEYLAQLDDKTSKELIQKQSFIGIYVSTKAEWVGGLKNKMWLTEADGELFFQWKLNVATCNALISTIRSCLDVYVTDMKERLQLERDLSQALSKDWLDESSKTNSLIELSKVLQDVEYLKQQEIASQRIYGDSSGINKKIGEKFYAELFSPLKRGITLVKRYLFTLKDSQWILCIDEAEFLDLNHHRILNTYLRADTQDLKFKITTTPYRHYTLDTNSGAPLKDGHDFDYVYIDRDETFDAEVFAENIFLKRIEWYKGDRSKLSLKSLLGNSTLLENKGNTWDQESEEMKLLEKYGNPSLVNRAKRLQKQRTSKFKDEVSRKITGFLRLREALDTSIGNKKLDVYSGTKMVVRCSDGNPRRLLRIFNALLINVDESIIKSGSTPLVPFSKQTDILIALSADSLERTKSEPFCGIDLYNFLNRIGLTLQRIFINRKLHSDLISSFEVPPDVTLRQWEIIERAVEWGLLIPVENRNNPNRLPVKSGRFHLAHILAPFFGIFPRRGKTIQLKTFLNDTLFNKKEGKKDSQQTSLFGDINLGPKNDN